LYLVPLYVVDTGLAARETRTITLFEPHGDVPVGQYGLIESYCPDPECDCRRVMINVVESSNPRRYLASIGYGFDRDDENAGPYLDPLNQQCAYAPGLLELVVRHALSDSVYLARLERHYALVKRAAADPDHPAYDKLMQACEHDDELWPARVAGPPEPVGRNDPCPCGSGKKYKRCCGRRTGTRNR
jgi:hypothetical protein